MTPTVLQMPFGSYHNGTVTLKNIDSSGNPGAGAFISNSAGTAGITVTNSSFDENFYSGLEINSNGAVVLSGVSASRNTGSYGGMLVDHAGSVTITNGVFNDNTAGEGLTITDLTGNITLTNVYADGNKGGMTLTTKGNITLTDVSASGNAQYGADLNTCHGTPCEWLGTGKVTITNGTFDDNPNNSISTYLRPQGAGARRDLADQSLPPAEMAISVSITWHGARTWIPANRNWSAR